MALTISEQMQQRKQQKFTRELTRTLSSIPAEQLNGFVNRIFDHHTYKPTADQFMSMVIASKFGIGNSIAEGGVAFTLETCVMAFNMMLKSNRFSETDSLAFGSYHAAQYDHNEIWNATFFYSIDEKLYEHSTELRVDDFYWAADVSQYLFLDNITKAYGFVIIPQPPMTMAEFKQYGIPYSPTWADSVDRAFAKSGFSQFNFPSFSTGSMEYISAVQIIFGTVDKLVQHLPDRARHNVSPHDRKLQSGKITPVRAHKRNTPLRLAINNRHLTNHVVYAVKDHSGQIRYVGEGKSDRHKHVNSGASHNWKINEYFFKTGEMNVEILKEGLTKSEALSIEKMLIKKYSTTELWNVRDYEPFHIDSDQAITDEELQGYLDM